MTLSDLLDRFDLLLDTPNAIPQLRQFILQLAVQGRITEQDLDDEPAEALLERIQIERQRLYDAGEIRKPKTFESPTSSEVPFSLPSNWTWTRLGIVTNYGRADKIEPEHISEETWVLGLGDIEKDTSQITARETFAQRKSKSTKNVFHEGDVLYGKLRPSLNKVILADSGGVCSTEILPLRGYLGLFPAYLLYALKRPDFLSYASKSTAGMSMPRLRMKDGRKALFPLPPLAEQKRIVETVDRLMDECDALEATQTQMRETQSAATVSATHALRTAPDADALRTAWDRVATHFDTLTATPDAVDELRQTILQLAVQGRLTEQDPDDEPAEALLEQIQMEKQRLYDAGEIRKPKTAPPIEQEDGLPKVPAHWIWTRLADTIFEMKAGSSPKCPGHPADPDTWGVLRTTAVQPLKYWQHENKELPDKVSPRKDHETKEGDLLITRAGPRDRVGVACSVEETRSKLMFSDKIIRCRGPLVSYLAIAINGGFPASYIDDKKSGMAESQMNISQTNLRATPIPLPPLAEQQRIVETVDRLMDVCDQMQEKLEQSRVTGEQWVEASLKETKVIRDMPVGAAQ